MQSGNRRLVNILISQRTFKYIYSLVLLGMCLCTEERSVNSYLCTEKSAKWSKVYFEELNVPQCIRNNTSEVPRCTIKVPSCIRRFQITQIRPLILQQMFLRIPLFFFRSVFTYATHSTFTEEFHKATFSYKMN